MKAPNPLALSTLLELASKASKAPQRGDGAPELKPLDSVADRMLVRCYLKGLDVQLYENALRTLGLWNTERNEPLGWIQPKSPKPNIELAGWSWDPQHGWVQNERRSP